MPRAPVQRGRPVLATVLAACGLALLAGALVASNADTSRLPGGVAVSGLDVGGLTPEVARSALRRHARALMTRTVAITTPDRPGFAVRVSPMFLGARPRIDDALREAQDADSLRRRLLGAVGLGGGRDVSLRFTLQPAPLEQLVDRVQSRLGGRPRPATVEVSGGSLRVVPGSAGTGVDEAELIRRLGTLPSQISLRVSQQPPQVTVEMASAARDRAQALLDAPPTVTAGSRRLRLPRALLLRALRFRPQAPELHVELDPATLAPALSRAFGTLETPVRDATIVPRGDVVEITPEAPGRGIDAEALARTLVDAPGATVPVRITTVAPAVTAASLRALGIRRRVSSFTTAYACCEARVTNIKRAAEILNGTIVRPGERLSLNEVLGERTTDRGFVSAPQIAGGKFEEAVGGGVSQMATTLYNAAFFAGLEIVTHTPHEYYLSRYPMGREATVSWGGPELIVRNDWSAAVYVSAVATDTDVTVSMYSTPLGRRVETVTEDPRDRVEPEVKRTVDPTLAPGEEVVDQAMGGSGFTVSYTRRVYRGDTLVRDERFTWTYRPENALVRTGPSATTTTPGGTTAPGTTTAPDRPTAPRPTQPQTTTRSTTGVPPPSLTP